MRPFKNILVRKTQNSLKVPPSHLEIIDYDIDTGLLRVDSDLMILTDKNMLLHEACKYGSLELILYALALNADLNSVIDKIDFFDSVTDQKDLNSGYTALIKAVNSGFTPAVE